MLLRSTPRHYTRLAGLGLASVWRSGWLCAWLAVACLTGFASTVRADEARDTARQAFKEGVSAAHEGQWPEAVAAFRRSQTALPHPVTLLNLAGALTQVGAFVEAIGAYEEVLGHFRSSLKASQQRKAERALAWARRQAAKLSLSVEGLQAGDEVRCDEALLDLGTQPLLLDPGLRRLTVHREGFRPQSRELSLARGESRQLSWDLAAARWEREWFAKDESRALPAAVVVPPATQPTKPVAKKHPHRRRRIIWSTVGVALIGGAIAAAYFLWPRPSAEPFGGNADPGTITVR